MTLRALFDPLMMTALDDFYPSLCTIQASTRARNAATGALVDTWADVAGLVGLACAIAPSRGSEVKRSDETYAVSEFVVSLPTYQPTITARHRAIVDGVTFDILLPQPDSHHGQTRLLVRRVS